MTEKVPPPWRRRERAELARGDALEGTGVALPHKDRVDAWPGAVWERPGMAC